MERIRKAVWSAKAKRNEKFADLLRRVRMDSGLSQRDLARRMQKPQHAISRLETGTYHITLVDLEDFANAVGLNPASMLGLLYPDPAREDALHDKSNNNDD